MFSKKMFCIITIYLMVSFTLQGDLLRCLKDTATIIGQSAQLVVDIKKKTGLSEIAGSIVDITGTIVSLIDDCDNPVCLDKATDRCNANNRDAGCVQWGAIIYPKCQKDFHNIACCFCSHNCPDGFRDDGLYCGKPGPYGRGGG